MCWSEVQRITLLRLSQIFIEGKLNNVMAQSKGIHEEINHNIISSDCFTKKANICDTTAQLPIYFLKVKSVSLYH